MEIFGYQYEKSPTCSFITRYFWPYGRTESFWPFIYYLWNFQSCVRFPFIGCFSYKEYSRSNISYSWLDFLKWGNQMYMQHMLLFLINKKFRVFLWVFAMLKFWLFSENSLKFSSVSPQSDLTFSRWLSSPFALWPTDRQTPCISKIGYR